jgi:hypothetical protein
MNIKSPTRLLQGLIIGGVLASAVALPSLTESSSAFFRNAPAPFCSDSTKMLRSVSFTPGEDRRCPGCHESSPRRRPKTGRRWTREHGLMR